MKVFFKSGLKTFLFSNTLGSHNLIIKFKGEDLRLEAKYELSLG